MPSCCVRGCSARNNINQPQLTLHLFPKKEVLRRKWLDAIGIENINARYKNWHVCSLHFEDSCFNRTLTVTRLHDGAVPSRSLMPLHHHDRSSDDSIQPVQELDSATDVNSIESQLLKICRLCLKIKFSLFSITKYKLREVLENLTGLSVNQDGLPYKLCSICAHKLQKYDSFRRSCIESNNIMLDIIKKDDMTILESIEQTHKFEKGFQVSTKIDSYDLEITEVDEKDINTEKLEEDYNYDNYDENLIFLMKNDTTEAVNDNAENNSTNEDNTETNYQFDSDDSLPLEQLHEKKKAEKKTKKVKKKKEIIPKIDRRRKPILNSDLNETLFTIIDLTLEEQIAEVEKRKLTDNYKHAVFKCDMCFKGFLDQHAYNSHMIRHTEECGEYECNICKTHFKQSKALRKHITAHHIHKYSCNQCSYVTTHRQTARLHERWHKGTKYSCPHCKEVFVKFTTYMGHVRIKHPSDFVCELCGYSFISAKGIELHKKLKHRGDDGVIQSDAPYCEPCNVRFATNDAYRKHLSISPRHVNKEDKDKNQPIRRKTSREVRERERRNKDVMDGDDENNKYPHQMKKPEGPIPCEQCGLQLEDSRAYHAHFRRMHPDKNRTKYPSMKSPCMCELCGRIFQSYALLKDHRWVHTGERPFKCEQCGKSFRMKQRLVAHRRVHADVKASYVCNVCGKQFTTQSNRHRHMFIHTGLKPFKCELCGKGFKHASEKRAHITYVHLKKPWPKRSRTKRNGQPMSPQSGPTSGQEICEQIPPVWQNCDPKLTELNNMISDKPMYYNIKI